MNSSTTGEVELITHSQFALVLYVSGPSDIVPVSAVMVTDPLHDEPAASPAPRMLVLPVSIDVVLPGSIPGAMSGAVVVGMDLTPPVEYVAVNPSCWTDASEVNCTRIWPDDDVRTGGMLEPENEPSSWEES